MTNEGNPDIRLHVNDTARWESQASGVWKIKLGKVIAIVPKDHSPKDVFLGLSDHDKYSYRYKGAKNRNHDSYLVAVEPDKGRAKPRVYWPLNRNLRQLTEEEAAQYTQSTVVSRPRQTPAPRAEDHSSSMNTSFDHGSQQQF